jgi:uncharacterized protein (DUF1800 family)
VTDSNLDLTAHLLRRAGFGAGREELEDYASMGYEEVVEDLLHPERHPDDFTDILDRYYEGEGVPSAAAKWMYRMVNTRRPLQEKMALFWHHVFATGWTKSEHGPASFTQIDTFRRVGMSNVRSILVELSRDPAMIFWLDNNENHKTEINENYGRELLELFSMGVGNYTEDDIKNAARAFTGWTFSQPIPLYPFGNYPTRFVYREDDHDDSDKTFLGQTGRFNGEDIIDIIAKQPATARFLSRHLYNFFVADEPQVPAWEQVPPHDPEAIETLMRAYGESGGDIRSILRSLFNSDSFKSARSKKVKSPAELVAGVIKLVGTYRFPRPGLLAYSEATTLMGQALFDPPTVEGWHTGKEWIDGGTLNERVNFAVNEVADATKPGVRAIIERLESQGQPLAPDEFVDQCLELTGPVSIGDDTRERLVRYAESSGDLGFGSEADSDASVSRTVRMIQLIVASREYQFA